MKKKVVIQGVPKSSKKKVVIEGLPKADVGLNMAKNKDERWDKQWKDYSKKPNSVANPLQTKGDDDTFYSGSDPYVENPKYSDSELVKNKKGLKNKKNVNWDFSNSNFGLFPLSGGKYAQRGFSYLNQIPGQIQDAVSIFKTGKPTEKKQYPIYNPYVNAYWNYAEGGYLPEYGDAGMTETTINTSQAPSGFTWGQSYSQQAVDQTGNPANLSFNSNPNKVASPTNFLDNNINLGKVGPASETTGNTLQKIGAVAAPVASTLQSGTNFAKQFAENKGIKQANDAAKEYEAHLQASTFASNYAPPGEEKGYGFTGRNALAADGMQIKQIGGMGEPNVEVEGEEHIQLPNGFSQEIQGKKHSEGGIPINLPQGTKIFSEKLKVPVSFLKEAIALDPENQMLKSLKLPKTGKVSYADLAKKFETKKYVDLLNSKDADAIQMTTAQLMIQQNNAKLEELFGLQEQNKLSGVHGPQVQQNAQQEQQEQEAQQAQQAQMQAEQMEQPMMKYGGYHLPKAVDGKEVTLPNGKKVTAVKVKEPGKEYKPVPNMPGYFYRTTTTTTPGTPGKAGVAPQKITKFMTDEQWKEYLKKETPEQKKRRLQREQGIPAIPPTPDIVNENEDYVYIEPEQKPKTPAVPQVVKQTYEVPGLNLGLALPNVYERMPLNYYKLEPEYIDPRYLDIQPQLNRIGRGQRAIESTLGSRGSSDMANLLQAQANRAAAEQEAYGQKYNYDRAQDAAAQQFNAQAKMNVNQYNQGSWFQQLEDPIRRREAAIGDQELTDYYRGLERGDQLAAYNATKNYIGETFPYYQNMTGDQMLASLVANNPQFMQILANAEKKKTKKKETETTEEGKYGGKVKNKIKIKPKLKNSYF